MEIIISRPIIISFLILFLIFSTDNTSPTSYCLWPGWPTPTTPYTPLNKGYKVLVTHIEKVQSLNHVVLGTGSRIEKSMRRLKRLEMDPNHMGIPYVKKVAMYIKG